MSPAHCIEDLSLSYEASLSRAGCVDPETGRLTKPEALSGTDIANEDETVSKIKASL